MVERRIMSDDDERRPANFKDVYAEGLTVGMTLGRKQGLAEAVRVLVLASEHTAAAEIAKYYERLLADERARPSEAG
jgi:hypothetical protein